MTKYIKTLTFFIITTILLLRCCCCTFFSGGEYECGDCSRSGEAVPRDEQLQSSLAPTPWFSFLFYFKDTMASNSDNAANEYSLRSPIEDEADRAPEDELEAPLIKGEGGEGPRLKESYPEVMLVALAAFAAYAAFVVQQKKLSDIFFEGSTLEKDALVAAKREFQHGKELFFFTRFN